MKTDAIRQNPFEYEGKWYWFDELGAWSKAYTSQRKALTGLLGYMRFLEDGPTWWQRIWWPIRYGSLWPTIKRFWHDTRGAD